MSIQTTLFGTIAREPQRNTIYEHPETRYEEFVKRYYEQNFQHDKSKRWCMTPRYMYMYIYIKARA